jgi:importin subunit beta-1
MSKLLTESPQVSSQASYALHNLATAFSEDDAAQTSGTNALTPFMPMLLETLLQVTDREDADEKSLRSAAFEAISALIQNGAPDCKPLFEKLLPVIVGRLQSSFSVPVLTNEDKERKEGAQGLICGLIQVLVYKLDVQDLLPHADSIMQNLLQVLQTRNATCHEEAFSATSAVCDKLEGHFDVSICSVCIDVIIPYLLLL